MSTPDDESSTETGDEASRLYLARSAHLIGLVTNPLHEASRAGDTEVVKQLLDGGVDEKDMHGKTALLLASYEGHTEVVQLLLDKGASLDEKTSKGGRTALMWASVNGHTEVVRLLLDTTMRRLLERGASFSSIGASVDEKDQGGDTALRLASYEGHMEVNPKPNPHPNLFPSPSPDPNP